MDNQTEKTNGTLKVSAAVIVSIAETAAAETEGVAVKSANRLAYADDAPFISHFVSPIRVKLNGDSAAISVSIVTLPGFRAYEVARAVQEHVKASVQNMTGIAVSKVNVRITAVKAK